MDTSCTDTKILYIHYSKGFVDNLKESALECIICDERIQFTTESYNVIMLPIEESLLDVELSKCVKVAPNDCLDDQQRFLKQREQKSFNRMRKGK